LPTTARGEFPPKAGKQFFQKKQKKIDTWTNVFYILQNVKYDSVAHWAVLFVIWHKPSDRNLKEWLSAPIGDSLF
jgi:hypothetical protein